MIIIHVSVMTKENMQQNLERTIREIQIEATSFEGCMSYEWHHYPDIPQSYFIHGEFDSQVHFEAYLNSNLVKRIANELIPLLSAPPQFRHFQATILDES